MPRIRSPQQFPGSTTDIPSPNALKDTEMSLDLSSKRVSENFEIGFLFLVQIFHYIRKSLHRFIGKTKSIDFWTQKLVQTRSEGLDGIPAEKYLILTPWPRHGRRKTFPARPTDPSADCASEFLPGRFLLGVDAATRAHVRANTGADGWKRGSAKAEGRGGGGGGGFAPRRDERTNGRMDGRTDGRTLDPVLLSSLSLSRSLPLFLDPSLPLFFHRA